MLQGLIIAVIVWLFALGAAIAVNYAKYKSKRVLTSRRILFGGTFLSAFISFVPIYFKSFGDITAVRVFKTVVISAYHSLRLFIMEGDFDFIEAVAKDLNNGVAEMLFTAFWAVMYLFAPLITFEAILSVFKNISSYRQYILKFFREAYVFSELNEKSLALAKSILAKDSKNLIIFTGVYENIEENKYDLLEEAKELGAICFKKDIVSVNFALHSKKSTISFFVSGEDESENVKQSFGLLKNYNDRDNTMLYVFSTSTEGELIMSAANKGKVKVRRIKDVRSLIYRALYDMEESVIEPKNGEAGQDIFMTAKELENGTKQIGAVVVGCGLHGTEMVKALSWFCQMDGYRVSIDVFDKDENAESKFTALCPELMSKSYNGVYVDGEAQYFIKFHSGIEVGTSEFAKALGELKNTTYVFTALGSDEDNITASVAMRTLFEQMRIHPIIQSVVYSSEKRESLDGIKNFKGQPYDIDFVGDLNTLYSEQVIIDSELEDEALERHLKYGKEEDFWTYEYNYRSSMASALHMKARIACGIAGADKKEEDLTESERADIEVLEHRRWNAYMRSEGYIYSGSKDKSSRNDLGKMHHDLVVFDELSEEEKRKDGRVGSK